MVLMIDGEPDTLLGGSSQKEQALELPTAYAKDARSQHFGEDGQLNYSFKAKRLLHYLNAQSDDNSKYDPSYTLIEHPEITVYDDLSPWFIEAQKGRVNSDNSVIQLSDSVIIHRTANTAGAVELKTHDLTIHLIEKHAKTNQPVTIRTDSGLISAVGMNADFTSQKIQLLSKVRGVHNPK